MSSGKVKCTCGWSWNKSDSSKKDMYICHECGRDNSNNMKNGGWLDNYNDSQASAPEGMVGDGFSNVGRNYSPAWGGQFEEGGEIPQAQFGLPISPIMPLVSGVANKFNDWFGDEPAKKPVKKPAKGKPRTLSIVDPRKKMATTNQPLRPNSDLVGGEYNSKHLDKLMQEAKRQKLSKQDMLNLSAMGFQETKWGRTDPNIGHTLGKWEGDNQYRRFISAYKAKMKEADRLGIKDPATRLQVYNGMGTVTPKTESKYHGFEMQKIYGVPIPKGGIDMAKNPLYGKQVMDIRDNVLAKNPEYMRYMDSISKAPAPTYRDIEDERRQMFATNPSLHLLMPERVAPPPPRLEMSGSRKQQARQNKLIDNGPSGASGSFPRTQGFAPLVAPKLAPLKKNEMGGSVYPVNYVPQAQDGISEDAMRGMMKSKIGMGNAFEHPAIKRMSQAMPKTGMTPEGIGTHYMSSVDNYAVPLLQDLGEEELTLVDPDSRSKEAIRFNSPEEAQYFAEHYKDLAPMSTTFKGLQEYAMGGSIPGAVGFSYARTQSPAPSNGKYAKKTMANAQNGKEMKYYQEGLDWKPKTISKNGGWLDSYDVAQTGQQQFYQGDIPATDRPIQKDGGVIKDDMGQWAHPGEITRISGGKITMKKDPKTGKALTEPLLGIADTGEQQWMYPGEDYNFEGANYVTEIPKRKLAKNGLRQEQKGLQNLDNLLNFTNYNKPQPGGWLDNY